MGDFLPGMFRMIEERFGRAGRPITTALLGLFALAIMAWCLGIIYDKVVGPVLGVVGKELAPDLASQMIAWATLVGFCGFIGWLSVFVADRIHGKRYSDVLATKRERIQDLESELTALRQDADGPIH